VPEARYNVTIHKRLRDRPRRPAGERSLEFSEERGRLKSAVKSGGTDPVTPDSGMALVKRISTARMPYGAASRPQ